MAMKDGEMLNIQVIDGAVNCTFSVFSLEEALFQEIFPGPGQDIEYVEDFFDRVGEKRAAEILNKLWRQPIMKRDANGIHGTLFFEGLHRKSYHDGKRECDVHDYCISKHQRELFSKHR